MNKRAQADVTATAVRIRTSVALELAIRAGVEDSLDEWCAETLEEQYLALEDGATKRQAIIDRVVDDVCLHIANLIDFGED